MSGSDYLLGYNQGRNSAENERETDALIERVIYARRTVQVDQSYLDRIRRASNHNFEVGTQAQRDAAGWEDKARQFRDEALYWRDQKFAPAKAEAKALREENAVLRDENAVLLARLEERNPDLTAEQAAHDETFKERQSLHRFRVIAASLIDALLAGRADRPEFAELLNMAKDAADTIERGDLFTAFRDEPEKNNRLCSLADALQKP
jgi:transposase-like protein